MFALNIRPNICKFITDMFRTSRVFIAVFSAGFALLAALLFVGCSGDSSPEGLGMPEFLSLTGQANKNSIVLTCTYKGRVGTCGFVVLADGEVVKRQEASERADGSFSLTVDGLEYDTEYTFYAWLSNGSAEIHSNTGTVHTESLPVVEPEITNVSAVVVNNSVYLTCTFKGDRVEKCGFVLSKSREVVKRQEASMGDGFFTLTIDELEYDTEYSYYAWITVGTEEIRSKTGKARTEKKPVVPPEILSVSYEADENVLTLHGTYKGDEVGGWGFYFNGTKYGSDSHEEGKFSLTIKDLEYDTDYNYQAYITSGQVEVTSDVKTAHTGKMSSIPIPDAAFKTYILGKFDLDHNGRLSMEEAEKITRLDINTYDLKIKSFEGIEYFVNLEYLRAVGYGEAQRGDVTMLDLSKNARLETLYCSFNRLVFLGLGSNSSLRYVDCSSNMLDVMPLELPDFGKAKVLEYLDCHSNPNLQLFLGDNKALKYIDCSNTRGRSSFSDCPALEYLDCSNCEFLSSGLNISGLKYLTTLKCDGGLGSEDFDASGCENLVFDPKIFSDNCFLRIKLRGCSKLTSLDICYDGKVTFYIDVTDCKNLKSLKCNGRVVDELYVGGCSALTELECCDNFLHELDVSSCKKLNLKAWPQVGNLDKLWIGSGEYHYLDSSGAEIDPAEFGTEVIVKQ